MREVQREKHRKIIEALHHMEASFLLENFCWFGGGTAIVLKYGEYRESLDIDFLCSDANGYRELRSAAVARGLPAFFRQPVESVRDFKADQYGIRSAFSYRDLVIKFEIIREARISLAGEIDRELGVPVLSLDDMFASKLLANADRCQDRSVAYRDAFDLGVLVKAHGSIPHSALERAVGAYGEDIANKLRWVLERLHKDGELSVAADKLSMDIGVACDAVDELTRGVRQAFPDIRLDLLDPMRRL